MTDLNRVFLAGNLTRDPEVRYIPSGKAVADLNLAISRKYRTPSGENKEETCFVNVEAWGRQAETAGEYLKKGSAVLIEGSLRYDQWETASGEKRSRLRVSASRIQFLDRAPRRSGAETSSASESAPAEESAPEPLETEPAGDDKADTDNLPF
ncbi:MAG: single-stranded DNA-binding protein [Lentisphaerae bacterium]|jgi:single-strand DNA-binding protein|nr:single-stranded DNA-binding protein [Lentisphaerota bacterium]